MKYLVDGEPVPINVRRERIARLVDAARAEGLTALVIFSHGARSGVGTHGHLRYLLDYTSGGPPAVLVLPGRSGADRLRDRTVRPALDARIVPVH